MKRRRKARFDDPSDAANQVREFLVRENALLKDKRAANSIVVKLSQEKRQRAIDALRQPAADKTLDEIMEERPELHDGSEYTVIIPTKYKHEGAGKRIDK